MWKEEQIKLFSEGMSFFAKVLVWIMFWEWIGILYIGITAYGDPVVFAKIMNSLLLFGIIWGAAKTTRHRIPIEAYTYIVSLFLNKPSVVEFYTPDGAHEKDENISKRVYKF